MDQMSIILFGIVALAIILLLTLAFFVFYSGLLHNVQIRTGTPPIGGFMVAYKFLTGPYKDVGYTFTEAISIDPKLKSFGVYYDNPKVVAPENLRAGVGCILAEGDKSADAKVIEAYRQKGYHLFTFPAVTSAVCTDFPFRSSWSVVLATFRVYPALAAYIEEHKLCGHPFLEIYEGPLIQYMVPLARQGDFYLPETEGKQSIQYESLKVKSSVCTNSVSNDESLSEANKKTE